MCRYDIFHVSDEVFCIYCGKYHTSMIHRHDLGEHWKLARFKKALRKRRNTSSYPASVMLIHVASGAGELRSGNQLIVGNV